MYRIRRDAGEANCSRGHRDDSVSICFALSDPSSALEGDVRVVGALRELGGWVPEQGLPLRRTANGSGCATWEATVNAACTHVLSGHAIEFKFVARRADGTAEWEPGKNRLLDAAGAAYQTSEGSCFTSSPRGKLVWEAVCDRTCFGDTLAVVGDIPELGNWDPARGLRLATSTAAFPIWAGCVPLDDGEQCKVKWKLVVLRRDGHDAYGGSAVEWESVDNRSTPAPALQGDVCISRVVFDGSCESAVVSTGEKDSGSGPARSQQQTLLFRASAHADVQVLFEEPQVVARPTYEPSTGRWVLHLSKLKLHQGLHPFQVLVDGEAQLSPEHLVAGSPKRNVVFVSEEFWLQTRRLRSAQIRMTRASTMQLSPRIPDKVTGVAPSSALSQKPTSKIIARPISSLSTASTCSCRSDVEEPLHTQVATSPQPFSTKVFAGLHGADLQQRLGAVTFPVTTTHLRGAQFKLWAAACRLQKPCGRCEDAYFLADCAVGVADGVGSMAQFARYGTDAALYAKELMELSGEALVQGRHGTAEGTADSRARSALEFAERSAVSYGASTAAVAAVANGQIGVANLGDSGFILLRGGPHGMAVVVRSSEQQHKWNCPYQLCRLPPVLQKRMRKQTVFDSSADCDLYVSDVRCGDLLLLFTDGLSDNLHDHEILQIVDRALPPSFGGVAAGALGAATDPGVLAAALSKAARERSLDEKAMVPFATHSRTQGMVCPGGKPDDITVVVAWIVPKAT